MKIKTCVKCGADFGTRTSTNKCETCRFKKKLSTSSATSSVDKSKP